MIVNIKNNTKIQYTFLIIWAVIFFFIYSLLIYNNPLSKFTWPDETANYFFIKNYIVDSDFTVSEPLNDLVQGIIKPRSFNVYQNNLVPGSFLGMLLIYGLLGKIISLSLIKFLTPLLAVLAGLFFYKILLKVFKPEIAFISALLFYLNPAWWYYASFSMLPNIAFISFLIIGFYFLSKVNKNIWQRNQLYLILGSIFIALALIIRTNEFLWVGLIIVLLFLIGLKNLKWYYPVLFIIVISLVFLPIFYYNNITYGSYLSFGYLRLGQGDNLLGQLPDEFSIGDSQLYSFVKFLVLPFGFHPKLLITNFYTYFITLFWWLFIPLVLGLFIFVKFYHEKNQGIYFLVFFAVSLYLLLYYGSWQFADQMTLQLNKIGISYVRYWLPIYILSLPFIVIFFINLINWFSQKKFKIFLALFLVIVLFYFSINIIFLSGNDNLTAIKKNISAYNEINKKIVELTEANAIIISQRSDKIFFPERKVIAKWDYDEIENWAKLLGQNIPLYYYAYEGYGYLDELNYNLAEFDMELAYEQFIFNDERLYKILPIEYE